MPGRVMSTRKWLSTEVGSVRRTATGVMAAALLLAVSLARAEDLFDIYVLAAKADPQIQAAAAAHEAALQAVPEARALLLPSVAFTAGIDRDHQEVTNSSFLPSTTSTFNTKQYALSLSQPVYDRQLWLQLEQSHARVAQADAQYASALQSLAVRVATAYFNVLAAADTLGYTRAEKSAIARQLEQARQRFQVGLTAITDVQEAQASYDLSVSQEIAANNQLSVAREALREITGHYHQNLAAPRENIPLITPEPSIDEWVRIALEQNFDLLASEAAAEVARQEVRVQRSQHLPTVDLNATHSYSDVGGGSFGGRNTEDSSIGLQLTLPIYSGGLVTARTREASHLYQQAQQQLEEVRRATERQSRTAYLNTVADKSQVEALGAAVKSNQTALQAAEAGNEVGTRTIVDVLDAQGNLYGAQRDYSRARYDYLLSTLQLKQAAGTLSATDVKQLNDLMK